MRHVATLAKRELLAYFLSPMAYVVLTVFLLLSGYVFFDQLGRTGVAAMGGYFEFLALLLLLILPLLTMRLFAEEFQGGTIETLMTAPVTVPEVVLAKYLAALSMLFVLVASTFLHAAALLALAEPDGGAILAGYLGLFLAGGFFVAVGLLASACVRTQTSAAVATVVLLLGLLVVPSLVPKDAADPLSAAVRYLGFGPHFQEFAQGVLDTRDAGYFLLGNALCVFLAGVVLAARRGRG